MWLQVTRDASLTEDDGLYSHREDLRVTNRSVAIPAWTALQDNGLTYPCNYQRSCTMLDLGSFSAVLEHTIICREAPRKDGLGVDPDAQEQCRENHADEGNIEVCGLAHPLGIRKIDNVAIWRRE